MTPALKLILRLEGAAIAAVGIALYAQTGAGWLMFVGLILLPDLFMVGYGVNARIGALCYNAGHSYLAPLALFSLGWAVKVDVAPVALIWTVHIGLDRAIGYGLKRASGFRDTHLS